MLFPVSLSLDMTECHLLEVPYLLRCNYDKETGENVREDKRSIKMLRIKHIGGERVREGNYWNFSNMSRNATAWS